MDAQTESHRGGAIDTDDDEAVGAGDWPEGWQKVMCSCGDLIGGYNRDAPPTVLQIQHGCGQVTVLYPSGMPPFGTT